MNASELASALAAKINALAQGVTATASGASITLTAMNGGQDSALSFATLYVNGSVIGSETFTGGEGSEMSVSPAALQFPAGGGVLNINISTEGVWAIGNAETASDDSSDEFAFKVYSLAKETTHHRLVHLQSRPLSFEYGYSRVHRVVAMVRAILSKDDNLTVALYGSDDLTRWSLLAYGTKTRVRISQIRTPPAAHSWRYYTIVTGGYATHDTDLGPVLLDYQPVIRRIG